MRLNLTLGGVVLLATLLAGTAHARMTGSSPGGSHMSGGGTMHNATVRMQRNHDSKPFVQDGPQARIKDTDGHKTKWKKPIDSDGGGPDDPPNKPKGGGTTDSGPTGPGKPNYQGPRFGGDFYQHPHYGGWGPPPACKGRPC